ncbi:MAG TPA: hypothetical protein VGJ26_09320 [Pirellulales bacterium]|jgi:hypothetical protein
MSQIIDNNAFDRGADPLFKMLTADQLRQLVAISPDHSLEVRLSELADRAQEGELRDEERAEYEGYVRANNLLAVLQGLARRRLAPGQAIQ